MFKIRQRFVFTIFLSIFCFLLLIFWFATILSQFIHAPINLPQQTTHTVIILLPAGSGIRYLATQSATQGLLKYPGLLMFYAYISGKAYQLKAGEYAITPGMNWDQLLSQMVDGKVVQHHVTFVEGWTFRQMREELEKNQYIHHTITNQSDRDIMAALGHPGQLPEGLFFPDTYCFTRGDTDIELLKRAYNNMDHHLQNAWANRAPGLSYDNPYQALIVASLVEKETALPTERAEMVGVILQRLKKHMRLQVDPTVAYGLGDEKLVKKEDLRIMTPYNTYKNYGLPPTPIAMPSVSSLFAAMHPISGTALYYVACDHGEHVFSATYKAHLKAMVRCKKQRALP